MSLRRDVRKAKRRGQKAGIAQPALNGQTVDLVSCLLASPPCGLAVGKIQRLEDNRMFVGSLVARREFVWTKEDLLNDSRWFSPVLEENQPCKCETLCLIVMVILLVLVELVVLNYQVDTLRGLVALHYQADVLSVEQCIKVH